ncbi:MAG: gliding-motility protein MglA [Sandaracinaceae bacterium]|nr:gliding-motility protein MglA [Sandaracinaceae bacterium]
MSFINYETKDIRLKVVFYGPAGSGKSAVVAHIHERTGDGQKISRGGAADGVYYDTLQLSLGSIRGFRTVIDLFTVPRGADHRETRRALLESIDGVVFVADSRPGRLDENLASIDELGWALRANGYDPAKIPLVIACGQADAPDATPCATLSTTLLRTHPAAADVPVFAVDAVRGPGVFESLKAISKLVLSELRG